jgi:thiol-disulfide isomerase/thioredoxin
MHTYRQGFSLGFRISRYLVCPVLLSWALVAAADYSYDPDADPAITYQAALQQSALEQKLVLLIFGSDWCPDCRSLNKKLGQAPLAATVEDSFVVAHVDVGNWDKNMAFTEQFGEPVAQGIPSIAIVAPNGSVLYVSEAGEFASARSAELPALDGWFRDMLKQIGEQ